MTSTETNFPRRSSDGASPCSPTLQRGGGSYDGKDEHEGYGRINRDAAIEAAVIGIEPEGASVEEELFASYNGFDPLSGEIDIGNAARKHALARRVDLSAPDPDGYGNPDIAAKSACAGLGINESIKYIPSSTGTHYLVVKAVEGEGAMTLETGLPMHVEQLPLP